MLLTTITISSRTLRPADGVLWDGNLLNISPIHTPSYVARGDGAEAPPPSADCLGDDFCRLSDEVSDLVRRVPPIKGGANLGDDCH